MAEKIVFMKEQELLESVSTITGGENVELGFSEDWELDTIRFEVPGDNSASEEFLSSLSTDMKMNKSDKVVELPVSAFIPRFSNLLNVQLEDRFDVCECNLYENDILYTFWIAA